MEIYEKLRVMRVFKGWSQEELAEKLGYSVSGYAKIERGETKVDIPKLERIAEAMGLDWRKLLELNEGNVFNLAENCTHTNLHLSKCTVVLSETQCVHELEKAQLIIEQQAKEIEYLREIIALMKKE